MCHLDLRRMDMKAFKITLITILSLVDLFLLYSTIGYLVLGIKTPIIVGNYNTVFMGMYIMSMTFFALFVVLTIVIVIMSIRFLKKSK